MSEPTVLEQPTTEPTPTLARLPASELEQWRESRKHPQPVVAVEPDITEESPASVLDAPAAPERQAKAPKKGSISERFATLTDRVKEAQRLERFERDRRESLEREIETLRRPAVQAQEVVDHRAPVSGVAEVSKLGPGKPVAANYDTYDEFVEALTDWKSDQKEIAAKAKVDAEQATQAKTAAVDGYRSKLPDARTRYADFDTVTANAQFPLTPELEHVLLTSAHGPDVAYYLASHPNEAAKVIAMPSTDQIRALGQLEARLEQTLGSPGHAAKPAVSISSAPAPISPVGSGATASVPSQLSPNTNLDQWRARKKALGLGTSRR